MCLDEKGDFFLRLSQEDTVLPSHLHKHDHLEMVYVLQGEIDFLIEGVHKRYRRGEVCLLNTNVRHVEEYHTDFTAIYLNMDPDYIRKVLNPGVLSGTEHTFAELTDFISRTQGDRFRDYMDFTPLEDSSGDMYRVCLRLLEEMMEKEPEYARMISLLLRRMFLFLQAPEHFSCSSTSYQIRAESTVVDRVLVLLHEQRRRLKRDEIADALGYNPSYLNRVFLEKTGQTLSEYNRRIYLREAAELLLNSSMSVSQIAEQMGFESRSAFYEQFRREYGMTPQNYRYKSENLERKGNDPMKYHTILFDLDGTLLNTIEDLTDSVNYVMEQYHCPKYSVEAIRSFVGNGIRNLMIKAVPGGEDHPEFEDMFGLFREYYLHHNLIKTGPYDGIMELLASLKEKKINMAIVSNKNQASVDVLRQDVFQGLIPIAIGDQEGRPRKPEPDGIWEAMKQLGLTSTEGVLYVGDSEVDAATAKNAGLDLVLVSWGFRSRELLETFDAVAIVDRPEELLAYV